MAKNFDISPEVQDRLFSKMNAIVDDLLKESSSGTDFKSKLDTEVYNKRMKSEPDGVVPEDITDDIRRQYADAYTKYANASGSESDIYLQQILDMEKKYPDLQSDSSVDKILSDIPQEQATKKAYEHIRSDIEQNMAQTDKFYYKNDEERKPVPPKKVKSAFGDSIDLNDIERNLGKNIDKMFDGVAEDFTSECKRAAQSKRVWADTDKIAYRKNTYESNGKTIEYTEAVQKVDWGRFISISESNSIQGFERLRTFIVRQLVEYFGGLKRIKSVVVRSQQLIINNVCYKPLIDPKYLKDASVFPLDSLAYIQNGCIAPLFDWRYLSKMQNLTLLDIDDTNFYLTDIASDIGAGRIAGLATIYYKIPSLSVFILGGEVVNRDDVDGESSISLKERLAKHKHFNNMADWHRFSVLNVTNGVHDYFTNSVKTYATSRGNKGFFMFAGGVLARSGAWLASGLINLNAHIVGGIFKGIASVFKDATTDVKPEDLD